MITESINFKELFDSWGFTKEEEKEYFDNELSKLSYVNGVLFWSEE